MDKNEFINNQIEFTTLVSFSKGRPFFIGMINSTKADIDFNIARVLGLEINDYRALLIFKFNAVYTPKSNPIYVPFACDNIYFISMEDAKNAVKYLNFLQEESRKKEMELKEKI